MYSAKDNAKSVGLPHSEIRGSKVTLTSPRLIAECHVLHRLSVPRHPPIALFILEIHSSMRRSQIAQTIETWTRTLNEPNWKNLHPCGIQTPYWSSKKDCINFRIHKRNLGSTDKWTHKRTLDGIQNYLFTMLKSNQQGKNRADN